MDDASAKGPARYPNGRFGPGHAGRPLGSRNRMSKRVALALLNHFAEHETEILDKINVHYFGDYLRLIGRLLPRPAADGAPDLEAMPAEDVERVLGAVRAALDRIEAGEGSLADIEAALAGAPFTGEGAVAGAVDGGPKPARPSAEIVAVSQIAGALAMGPAAVPEQAPPITMEKIW